VVRVDASLKSSAGHNFDQQPRVPEAQPFSSGFETRSTGVAGSPECGDCGPGYACTDKQRCAVVPTCEQACGEGMVCDQASVQCVENCSLIGLCPSPSQQCDLASGLCR
jgi:hypothetical protein